MRKPKITTRKTRAGTTVAVQIPTATPRSPRHEIRTRLPLRVFARCCQCRIIFRTPVCPHATTVSRGKWIPHSAPRLYTRSRSQCTTRIVSKRTWDASSTSPPSSTSRHPLHHRATSPYARNSQTTAKMPPKRPRHHFPFVGCAKQPPWLTFGQCTCHGQLVVAMWLGTQPRIQTVVQAARISEEMAGRTHVGGYPDLTLGRALIVVLRKKYPAAFQNGP